MTPSRLSHVPGVLSLLVLLSRPAISQEPPTPPTPPTPPAGPEEQTVDLKPSFLVPQGKGGADASKGNGVVSHTPGVVFTSDGKRMITATSADEIVVFETGTRKLLKRIKIPGDGHDGVSIDSRGRYAAWVLKKGGVIVMDLESGKVITRDDDLRARWIAIDPAGLRIAVSRGKEIEIRELHSLKLEFHLEGHKADVTNLSWSADSRRLGSTAQDGALLVHNVEKRRIDYRARKPSALHALAFSPDGTVVAFGGMDKQIYIYDFDRESESLLTKDTDQPFWITCLGFSPDGRRLAVGDESCDIWLYDMASGKRIFHNKHHVECWLGSVAWAPDNETFLFGCRPNTHSQVPAIYRALTRVEAARDNEVRKSRERLLEKIATQLAKEEDAGARSALEQYQLALAAEEKVQTTLGDVQFSWNNQIANDLVYLNAAAPGAGQVTDPQLAQTESAESVQTLALTKNAGPTAYVSQESGSSAIEKLPPELRKLASEHQALLEQKMATLSNDNFCLNQWTVKGK